jgi:DNA-binding NtrC family response regulator
VTQFGAVVGRSHAMQRLYPLCERLAQSDVPLVIEGETGTGKEVLAEALHRASARRDGPFVVFDCTTVAPTLLESELFGHEKGAFTGATTARKGLFEQAEGGTLFVDEVGDLDLALQPKLLRAVERREVRRVGGSRAIRVDVRIIAATRRDLDREVVAGRFRDDLFHRLAVGRIELPALRERQGDVRELVGLFCEEAGRDPAAVPTEVMARWEDARWPGNVRELRNAIEHAVVFGEHSEIDACDLPPNLTAAPNQPAEPELARLPMELAALERRDIEAALRETGGRKVRAAALLGIDRGTLYNKLKAYGLS